MGKPTEFSQAVVDAICERLADGESLRSICSGDDMPSRASVFRWLSDETRQAFRDQYAHARDAQADALADEIVDIADDSALDIVKGGKYGDQERVNAEVVARARLRVDARKWVAAKLKPKKYGDKIEAEVNHNLSPEAQAWLGISQGS
jgi:hypothetical protein